MTGAIGLVLVTVTMVDLMWTALAPGAGGGPVTRRLGSWLWRLALRIHRTRSSHRFLSATGPMLLVIVFASWVLTVAVGWWLVFVSSDGAVRDASTGASADLVDRLYFTGFTVFTLGVGDFVPGAGLWQVATVAATLSGLVLVTLGITYLVPVGTAVTQRRQLASQVAAMGDDAEAIVTGAWSGHDFGMVADQLRPFISEIAQLRERHLAYPVVDYFHPDDPQRSLPFQLVQLALAVEAFQVAVTAPARPEPTVTDPLLWMIDTYLSTVVKSPVADSVDQSSLPPIDLNVLRSAGIPTVTDEEHRAALDARTERHAALAALLESDGWDTGARRG